MSASTYSHVTRPLDSISIYGQDTRLLDAIYPPPASPPRSPVTSPLKSSDPSIPTSKCHLLSIPLELRQHIYSYLLPCTSDILAKEQKFVWIRGNTALLSTCRQIHEECAGQLYGTNTFSLYVVWDCIIFDYAWILRSSLQPRRRMAFPETFSMKRRTRGLRLIKKIHVRVHHMDSYTGELYARFHSNVVFYI